MTIKLDAILREFVITEYSTKEHRNFVFDCHAVEPDGQSTKFSRYIVHSTHGSRGTCIYMDDDTEIGSGEDPRPFYWRGSACILSQTLSRGHGFVHKLFVKNLNKWFILVPPENLKVGKNWVPFVRDEELYIIHEYAPFRVMKAEFMSRHDDFMVLNIVAEHKIAGQRSHDKYSMYRGGSNALQIDDFIVGCGHTNEAPTKQRPGIVHRPFVFVYKPDTHLTYYSFAFDFPETYNIVDPTSFYLQDNKLFLITSETEDVWTVLNQKGRICRYAIDLPEDLNEYNLGLGGQQLHRWAHDRAPKMRSFFGGRGRS